MRSWIIVALLLMFTVQPAAAQSGERCFPETGHCITGRIREYWEQNGALPVFGFPIGPQQVMTIEGQAIQAQPFERNRLELHPENQRPYDVLLGRLGADRLAAQGRDWFQLPKGGTQPGCRYFPETDQSVCGELLNAWRANGLELDGVPGKTEGESLALWGLPLSGVLTEQLSDGKSYQVQWFERARFESHPENQPPYHVLFGLLGNELATAPPSVAPAPAPQPAPAPEYAGTGTKVIDVSLGDTSRITLSHTGSKNFIVWAYGAGDRRELLANTIGPYQGSTWLPAGQYSVEIKADGDWRLATAPLGNDPNARVFAGRGDSVSPFFSRPGRTVYVAQHDGSRNFIVWLRCAQGDDLIENTIGAVSAEVVIDFAAGPCFWDVRADGNWSVRER